MKGIFLALLATLVGLAMVGGGVYGVVKDFEDDDDAASARTTTPRPVIPTPPLQSTPAECEDAAARDFRLRDLSGVTLEPHGRETGVATMNAVCNGATVALSVRMEGMREQDTWSYNVWLYADRRNAKRIGSLIGSSGRGFGSATIDPGVDTSPYDQIVISRVDFAASERRPKKIVFSGPL